MDDPTYPKQARRRRTLDERQARLAYQIFLTGVERVKVSWASGNPGDVKLAAEALQTSAHMLTVAIAKVKG